MSIGVMSLVFQAQMPDLSYKKDGESRNAKASTVKLILLAYADHANDEGEGAYPGYDKLEIKTALSRQGISDTLEAIKQNGFMIFEGVSKYGTNSYRIDKDKLEGLVKPLDSGKSSHLTQASQATRPEPSLNHPLNQEIEADDAKIFKALESMYGGLRIDTPRFVDAWLEKHPVEKIMEALDIAKSKGNKPVQYIDSILLDWEANGYPKTREQKVQDRKRGVVHRVVQQIAEISAEEVERLQKSVDWSVT